MHSMIVSLGWIIHIVVCFYFIRLLKNYLHRAILTIIPCFIFLFVGCHNLPYLQMSSVMTVSLYWTITIRLFHLTVFSPYEEYSFLTYIWKFLWFFIPIIPCQSKTSLNFYLLSIIIKIFFNHWTFQWLHICPPGDSYGRIAIFYIYICTGTFIYDLLIILIRLITRHQYTVLDFNDYPFLSKSIREFWGRRYNRLIGKLLKESIFDPIRRLPCSSTTIAALASFIVSGLLHAHVATAAFGASSPLPAFIFFVLQGIACCTEIMCPFTLPKAFGILLTHAFLLVTSPLYIGLFTRAGPLFHETNKPLLYDTTWFPKLPVPHFCP